MTGSWDIYCDELGKIIFPESWSDALLQRVVVGDYVSNICEMRSTLLGSGRSTELYHSRRR